MKKITYFLLLMIFVLASCQGTRKQENANADAEEATEAVATEDKGKALQEAAKAGDVETVRTLLKDSADITSANDHQQTALMLAANAGATEIVELLLSSGADINASCAGGYTPLHYAADNGHVNVARLLLSAGADASVKDKGENTALDLAKKAENAELVTLIEETVTKAAKVVDAP